eukprot:COSAG05_NODE_182_length_14772_cov_42.430655_4_plen_70_part_00
MGYVSILCASARVSVCVQMQVLHAVAASEDTPEAAELTAGQLTDLLRSLLGMAAGSLGTAPRLFPFETL